MYCKTVGWLYYHKQLPKDSNYKVQFTSIYNLLQGLVRVLMNETPTIEYNKKFWALHIILPTSHHLTGNFPATGVRPYGRRNGSHLKSDRHSTWIPWEYAPSHLVSVLGWFGMYICHGLQWGFAISDLCFLTITIAILRLLSYVSSSSSSSSSSHEHYF